MNKRQIMKKEYLELELELVMFLHEDVLTNSSESDVTDDPYVPGEEWW